jgi:hypothetical protein
LGIGDFNNDYNPLIQATDGETPTLDVVLQSYINAAIRECRVWLPVTVLAVIPGGTTQVTVQSQLLRTFPGLPAPVPLPPFQNVPVFYPRGTAYGIKLPVAVDDSGILLFCDRSLDIWKVQPAPLPVWPESNRAHDLSDGVFIPGAYPLLTPPAPQLAAAGPLDLAIYNGLAQLFMQPGGTFIQGNTALNSFQLLVTTVTTLNTALAALAVEFAAIASGPTPVPAVAFGAFAAPLAAATAALTTLTASFTALTGVPGA